MAKPWEKSWDATPASEQPATVSKPWEKAWGAGKTEPKLSRSQLVEQAARKSASDAGFLNTGVQAFARQIPGYERLLTAGLGYTNADLSPQERSLAVASYQDELKKRNTLANLAGGVGGFLSLGKAVGTAAKALEGVPLIGSAARALAPVEGQGGLNALRRAAGGAVVGGTTGGLEEGSQGVLPGAIGGAGGALVAPSLVKAGTAIAKGAGKGVQNVLAKIGVDLSPDLAALLKTPDKATALLAKFSGETADTLEKKAKDFKEVFGRSPTLSEVATPELSRTLQTIGQRTTTGGKAPKTLSQAAEKSLQDLPKETSAALTGKQKVFTPTSVKDFRDRMADQEFDKLKAVPVTVTPDIIDFLKNPELKDSLTRAIKNSSGHIVMSTKQIKKEIDQVVSGESPLFGGLVNAIRKSTNMADFRRGILDLAAESEPKLRRPIKQYARLSTIAEGIKEAPRMLPSSVREFSTDFNLTNRAKRFGAVQGLRNNLIRKIEGTPDKSGKQAKALVDNPNYLDKLLLAFGPEEQARLVRAGKIAATRAENSSALARLQEATPTEKQANLAQNVIDIFAAGHAGGAFRAHLAAKFVSAVRMPPTTAEKIAQMATDPSKVGDVIAELRGRGVKPSVIAQWLQDAATAQAGAAAAS